MAGFKNLEDLVGDLGEGLRKLRAGELEPEELNPLVADARELYDRLTLLRFKAHEFSYEVRRKAPQGGVDAELADRQPVRPFRIGAAYQTSLIDAIEEVSREQVEQAEEARRAAGTPGLFDRVEEETAAEPEAAPPAETAGPLEAFSDQDMTSGTTEEEGVDTALEDLIFGAEGAESREAEEEVPPVVPEDVTEELPEKSVESDPEISMDSPVAEPEGVDRTPPAEGQPTLAERMEKQPIDDLRTAFSLVEKYECIKMLFADDAGEFNRVLEALEGAGTFELALHWLGQQVPAFSEWDREDPTVMRFLERVERRYP